MKSNILPYFTAKYNFYKPKTLLYLRGEALGRSEDKVFRYQGSSTCVDPIFVETNHPGPHPSRYTTTVPGSTAVQGSFATHWRCMRNKLRNKRQEEKNNTIHFYLVFFQDTHVQQWLQFGSWCLWLLLVLVLLLLLA